MLLLSLVHLAVGLTPSFAAPAFRPAPAPGSGVERLLKEVETFRRRFAQNTKDGEPISQGDASRLVEDLRNIYRADKSSAREVLTAFLDIGAAAHERRASRGLEMAYDRSEASILNLTERALRPHLRDAEQRDYLTRDVLLVASRHSPGRRAAATRLFRHHRYDSALLGLLHNTRSEHDLLRQTSLETVVGWSKPVVNHLMAKRLGRPQRTRNGRDANFAERHFKTTRVEANSRSEALLEQFVKSAVTSKSWREASLGISVMSGLDPLKAAPILINGLEVWNQRGEQAGGALRIRHELADALQARSGRNLALRADRWAIWWAAIESGEITLAEAGAERGPGQFTSTGFFGINPKSDRVTFVIDRSGSMDVPFASRSSDANHTGLTRYQEATRQLAGFLEGLGENGRFSVVLFSDRASVWRTKLQSTSRTNVNSARKWLKTNSPDGGTFLRDGIHKAFQIDRRGKLDLNSLEADTIVVLCDGATTEGSGWVRPFLGRQNKDARVKFHCIQIGPGGDGTLELLASETGGDFRRIAH